MTTLSDQVTQHIHATGGRLTSQRLAILDALEVFSGHPTADEVYQSARQTDPSINLSTVYRTLRWLEAKGLISQRFFDDDRGIQRFDPAAPADHYHFRCTLCNKILEFHSPLLEFVKEEFESNNGDRVDSANLVFYGTCRDCR